MGSGTAFSAFDRSLACRILGPTACSDRFVSAVDPRLCSSASTPLFPCRGICCSDRFVSAVEPCLWCSASTPLFPCRGICCSDRFVSAVEPCLWCSASTPLFPYRGICCSDRFVSAVESCLWCSASTPLFPCGGTCCSDRFVSAVEPCLWCAASTPSFPCGGTCLWRGVENASVQLSAAIAEASSHTRACRRHRASHRKLAVSAFARHRAATQTMQTSEAGMVSVLPLRQRQA